MTHLILAAKRAKKTPVAFNSHTLRECADPEFSTQDMEDALTRLPEAPTIG